MRARDSLRRERKCSVDQALHRTVTMTSGTVPMKHAGHTCNAVTLAAIAALVLTGLLGGCSEGSGAAPCLAEDVERCFCADGRSGFQVCGREGGSGIGACNCDEVASPYLPGVGSEAGAGDATTEASNGLSFMSACDPSNDQCPSGTSCDAFPSKGPHCSKPCAVPADCPAPSPGCNMMNICKAP